MFRFTKVLSLLCVSGALFAAPTTTTAPAATATTSQAPVALIDKDQARIVGEFDLRPSYTSKAGEIHTEDTVNLGYQFDRTVTLDYTQYFLTNFMNPDSSTSGTQLRADDGFARLKLKDVIKENDTTLGVQTRVYLPTHSGRRDAGMVMSWRNQVTIAQKLNNSASVDFTIAPYLHAYNRPGTTVAGADQANPWFTQRLILNADVNLTDKLTLSVPFYFDANRTRNFSATAKNNDSWNYMLVVWPEVNYQLTSNVKIGGAWYSDNFLVADGSGFALKDGAEKGVFQLIMNYSL